MPAVFVHGVPETPVLWDPLRSHLQRDDVVALQLPGFGCARPEGFGATKEEYVAWLVGELEGLQAQGPIDLVGHDWGGGLTVRLVSIRSDLVQSWVTDAAGLGDLDFEWHDFAKIWQTPGAGEEFFARNSRCRRRSKRGVRGLRRAPRRSDEDGGARPDDGRLHPRALPLGHERREGVGARLQGHSQARDGRRARPTIRSWPRTWRKRLPLEPGRASPTCQA